MQPLMRLALGGCLVLCLVIKRETLFAEETQAPPLLVPDSKLSARLEGIVKEHKIPGMVAAVVEGANLVAAGAAGVRKLNSPELITVNDRLHLGSCTKAMTATRIAMLVEEGKLSWDSTLADLFPAALSFIHEDYHHVTLTELLTHRAGLPANVFWPKFSTKAPVSEQRMEVLLKALDKAPQTKPGTKFEYSNVGYVVAGAMAEKVTGQSWEEFMREGLFKPLQMHSAGFGPPGDVGAVNEPWGHLDNVPFPIPMQHDNPAVLGPAGTVHCSIADWGKFASFHLTTEHQTPTLLRQETFARLHTPPEGFNYAMGWIVLPKLKWAGASALAHDGSNTMWYSTIVILPEKNLALLVVANLGGDRSHKACEAAVKSLLEYYETELKVEKKPDTPAQ